MDFCQRFGPEIAYCLNQPLCGYNINVICVCKHALLFLWRVMAVEVCTGSVAQYTIVLTGLNCVCFQCVCMHSYSFSFIYRWMNSGMNRSRVVLYSRPCSSARTGHFRAVDTNQN